MHVIRIMGMMAGTTLSSFAAPSGTARSRTHTVPASMEVCGGAHVMEVLKDQKHPNTWKLRNGFALPGGYRWMCTGAIVGSGGVIDVWQQYGLDNIRSPTESCRAVLHYICKNK